MYINAVAPKRILPRLIGVYIHLPYCDVKCAYCDFFSLAKRHIDANFWPRYLDRLRADLAQQVKLLHQDTERPVLASVFFGGGTPSKAPARVVAQTIEAISAAFAAKYRKLEITAEANPESLNYALLVAWREAGVNRVSVGMQSREEKVLRYLGRLFNRRAYNEVLQQVRAAGFTNYNADFITGVPGQTIASTLDDLRFAIGEGATHVSLYQLTIEPGTLLRQRIARGELPPIDDRQQNQQMRAAVEFLCQQGLERYEISNFARSGYRCLHNLIYWTYRPYLGLGVAAHSFTGRRRFYYPRSLEQYFASRGAPTEDLGASPRDALLGQLRLLDPMHPARLLRALGAGERQAAASALSYAETQGWLERRGRLWQLTERGLELNDTLLATLWNVGQG